MSAAGALAGLSLLIVGDSHVSAPGSLATTLHDALAAEGAAVYTAGVCAASPSHFLKGRSTTCGRVLRGPDGKLSLKVKASAPKLEALLADHAPDHVIFVFGDNMGGYRMKHLPRGFIETEVMAIVAALPEGTGCSWMGPPWGEEGTAYRKTHARAAALNAALREASAPCHYIDVQAATGTGTIDTVDGLHPKPAGYRMWAEVASAALVHALAQASALAQAPASPPDHMPPDHMPEVFAAE